MRNDECGMATQNLEPRAERRDATEAARGGETEKGRNGESEKRRSGDTLNAECGMGNAELYGREAGKGGLVKFGIANAECGMAEMPESR